MERSNRKEADHERRYLEEGFTSFLEEAEELKEEGK